MNKDLEQQIRAIVQEEMLKNYGSGSPQTPPHEHNGTDNLTINSLNVEGFQPLPATNKKYLNPNGSYDYGFASSKKLAPASPGHTEQYIDNPNIGIYPIPIVVGNGVGTQSAFNGGYAPNGTLVYFANGTTLNGLYVRFDGQWYGVTLTLTA